ncbi:hypothetical protein KKB64_04765 [Patescibacteria group bacterium]|nr:hypothetical protein [Patescibacteria group bacterium]MBU1473063.1 hypothetical protein [Patescibacteria group bacterium]MBU2460181.1 hypothetical protein [Patescibacteria group bacterium]MBU2544497.1 hypothetical protein [Patescibacteria group bacterium]
MPYQETSLPVGIQEGGAYRLWEKTQRLLAVIFPGQNFFVTSANHNTPTICAYDAIPVTADRRRALAPILDMLGYGALNHFLTSGGMDTMEVTTYHKESATNAVEVGFYKVREHTDGGIYFRLELGGTDDSSASIVLRTGCNESPSFTRGFARELAVSPPSTFPICELLDGFIQAKQSSTLFAR